MKHLLFEPVRRLIAPDAARRGWRAMPRTLLLLLLLGLAAARDTARTEVVDITREVAPGTAQPIPVSVSGFSGEALEVIQFDLYVQGFRFVSPEVAQFVLSGGNNGNLSGRAMDRINQSLLVNKSYTGASLRRQAHAFVEDFIRALGRTPIDPAKKIAFKLDTGGNSEIYLADFDGHGAQAITRDDTIVAAPAWVPGRLALYYTSYRLGNPDILFHDLSSGQRRVFARYPGLNTSAAPSPDGRRVAMILSKGGSPDVYVADADGGNLTQLTHTPVDESSPCWSPDGRWICFATKIHERRVLAKVPSGGGPLQVISTRGVSNPSEPDWSPDGRWIAFTAQMRDFEICVVPSEGGSATVLASGEDPSWAGNSRTLVFVRRQGGRRVLSLLDVPTKQAKDASRFSGSSSQPSWAR